MQRNLPEPLDPAGLGAFLQRRVAVYDKDRDGHYNLISALHKAVRGSDPQAALYLSGADADRGRRTAVPRPAAGAHGGGGHRPCRSARRCRNAWRRWRRIAFSGSPEGELALVQACLYLATAPKSNAVYLAQKAAWKSAKDTGQPDAGRCNIVNPGQPG